MEEFEFFYTVYKTTNSKNGKVYIGCHKTYNLDDGYMGSGKLLKLAINEYGVENFTKEILFIFDNPEDMYAKERELVNIDFISSENSYNMKIGGFGGWTPLSGNFAYISKYRNNELFRKKVNNSLREISVLGLQAYRKKYPKSAFYGKNHTEDTKIKIGYNSSVCQTGKGNSQYGTMWITNGYENRKIKNTGLIPEGWRKGRVLNNSV